MKSVNDKSCTDQETARKPYVAPRATRLSPDQAKELLVQRADINDPRSSACSDKSKNFGGSKTHRATSSKMLHGGVAERKQERL